MIKKMMIGFAVLLMLLVLVFTFSLWRQAVGSRSMEVSAGLLEGRLQSCPASPNCVSSQASAEDSHYIAPVQDSDGSRWSALPAILDGIAGVTRISLEDTYGHYTFQTPLLGFVDDVEFLNSPEEGVIHVRSASRVGYSDMNANRKRIESLRSILE